MPARDDVRPPARHGHSYRPGRRSVNVAQVEPADDAPSQSPHAQATDAYRREARRLRQRYAGQPDLLHYSLRDLSRRHDRANRPAEQPVHLHTAPLPKLRPVVERVRRAPAAPPLPSFGHAVVNWFADRVAATVDSRLLIFSERHALLKTAERLGIDRFHANLIVAVAQHQAEGRGQAKPQATPISRKRSLSPIVLIIAVQALIVLAGWWVLR